MLKHLSLSILLLLFSQKALQAQEAKTVKIIKLPELQKILSYEGDKILVLNFWATWCAPCVKELPYLEQIHQNYKDKNVEVVLVSLDFAADVEKAKKLLAKKNIQIPATFLLDETDYDAWIDRIEPSWQGAIPATLVLNNAKKERVFINQETNYQQLESVILKLKP
jgi:thiol-disulfide isomerase/thioredoxin